MKLAMEKTEANSDTIVPPVCTLAEALNFNGEQIIYRFLDSFDISFEEASDIFEQTKKWLWLCATELKEIESGQKKESVVEIPFNSSLVIIDEMWHNFMLFSPEYVQYCQSKFGFYIHHTPFTNEMYIAYLKEYADNPEIVEKKNQEKLHALYSYVYDKLGATTVRKWFSEYTDKYLPAKFDKLYIKYRQPAKVHGTEKNVAGLTV